MSILKEKDSRKWISTFFAISSILVYYVLLMFFRQVGEWFDLEAEVKGFDLICQGLAVVLGVVCFVLARGHEFANTYLQEVYNELLKVRWADRDSTFKLTFGIIVGVFIVGLLLVGIDSVIRWGFGHLYEL